MKRVSILTISLVIVSFMGLFFFYVTAEASYDPEVYRAQQALKELGYDPGSVDGFWGKKTSNAVKMFQRNKGLTVTGLLDRQTKGKLNLLTTNQKRGAASSLSSDDSGRGIPVRPVSPSGAEVSGNQWLFVIGIDTYIEWPRLKTAVNDAKSVRNVLLSHYHFNKVHFIELYDEQATRKDIIGKLRYLAKNVQNDDSLVIFYAGHGHLDSITKTGSWIPVESGIKEASAWISNHDIKNYLKVDAIKAKHILLISDSCFSGDFFRGHRGKLPEVTDKAIKRAYRLTSRQAITSGGLEPVSDEGFGKNSVFSHFLIRTLKENKKPFLVTSDFFPEIKAGVAENAEQFPRFGSLKGTGGQQGGELVFFLKQDSRLDSLGAEASRKKAELEHLRQMKAAAEDAKNKEAEEIAKQEKELAKLDTKIRQMKKRLGSTAQRTNDSLEALLAMVRQKEEQAKRLKGLEQKRRKEEQKRIAEIEKLKEEQQRKKWEIFNENVSKYLEIVSSKFGKDLKEPAWKSLIERYPEGKGLKTGNINGLKLAVKGVGRLFIKTEPKNAKIKILNIGPKFYQGMELKSGQYNVAVSSERYKTKKMRVTLSAGEDKNLSIHLDPVAPFTNSLGMKFVYIPSGTFMMGSPTGEEDRDNDEKQHRVSLTKGFYMQTTEVPQDQWKAVMDTRPWSGKKYVREGSDYPAVYVSWNDCQKFVRKLNQKEGASKYRLPTEAEWEYACRAGSDARFCFGDDANLLGNYAWYDGNADSVGEDYAHRVGIKRPNSWGLYDMHGNVYEWCQDIYSDEAYSKHQRNNPIYRGSGSSRVIRGGGWVSNARLCRSADRFRDTPGGGDGILGFRLSLRAGGQE